MKITSLDWYCAINWNTLLLGSENWSFLFEIILRTAVMFLVVLISLRVLRKRSVGQLSVFELGVIIGLGSAAGDPMFYKDVGLLPGIAVFLAVVAMYSFIAFLGNRFRSVESIVEGKPAYVAEHGKLNIKNFRAERVSHEEFFSQLRQKNITHLGQLKYAILETTGMISVIYFPDDSVEWGLPVLPHLYAEKLKKLPGGKYACTYCGQVEDIMKSTETYACPSCQKDEWILAMNDTRIT